MHITVKRWRFVVSLHSHTMDGKYHYICTGSVITRRIVLTAAHCMEKEDPKTGKKKSVYRIFFTFLWLGSRARQGEAAQGEAAQGEAAQGEAAKGEAAQGEAAQSEATQGEAAQGEAAQGEAAQGEAAQGETATVR